MGSFNFLNLSESVRQKMLSEVDSDFAAGNLYISSRLNSQGCESYLAYLKESIQNGSEETLESLIKQNDCLNKIEVHNGVTKKVPKNAAQLIAQSEFNRFYIRAVCLEAIEKGITDVEVYRARESSWARPESEALLGCKVNAADLLTDLRASIGASPQLLPDINSGLSVKIDFSE